MYPSNTSLFLATSWPSSHCRMKALSLLLLPLANSQQLLLLNTLAYELTAANIRCLGLN